MQELRTKANLIDAFENGNPVAVLPRRELDSMLSAGEWAQLWLEIGRDDGEDIRLVSVDLTTDDLEDILGRSTGDDVVLALDGYALHGLFDDAEVEAHGFRGALAVAVVAGAIAAPAGNAANLVSSASNPLVSTAAAKAQVSTASSRVQAVNPAARPLATKAQTARPASKAQAVNPAAKAQAVKPQVAKVQVSKAAAKAQVSKTLVVKASGLRLLNRTLAR